MEFASLQHLCGAGPRPHASYHAENVRFSIRDFDVERQKGKRSTHSKAMDDHVVLGVYCYGISWYW